LTNYPELSAGTLREFVIRCGKTPSGSQIIDVFIRYRTGYAQIERCVADSRAFTAAEVDGLLATLRDAFMRELIVTKGIQLTLEAD
jgi:hypothetical protein